MQDDVVINNLSARDTDDVAETRISLFLSCTLPRDIPEWIIDVLDGGILREENIIARYSSNPTSNLLKDPKDEALFRVRASEIGAQYPQVCKQVSKLKSHPATEFLYYHFQSVYKS